MFAIGEEVAFVREPIRPGLDIKLSNRVPGLKGGRGFTAEEEEEEEDVALIEEEEEGRASDFAK
jgi:hypothetical protein